MELLSTVFLNPVILFLVKFCWIRKVLVLEARLLILIRSFTIWHKIFQLLIKWIIN